MLNNSLFTTESFLPVSGTHRQILKYPEAEELVTLELRHTLEQNLHIFILFINIFGVVTNSINLRVFVRQGIASDTTTIGLSALALSDLMGCIFMIPASLCYVVKFVNYTDYRNCVSLTSMTCHYPHVMFSRITCWLTVYISLERTLCVLMPLKVKFLLRPRVARNAVLAIFVFFFIFHVPFAANSRIIWVFNPAFNRSMTLNVVTEIGLVFLYLNSLIGTTILSTVAMVIVAITTSVMLYKLKTIQKWRKSISSASKSDSKTSKKDLEVFKTVTMVTAIYLLCLIGGHTPGFAMLFFPGVSITGVNSNLFLVMYTFKYVFDAVNSSVNFLFYIHISSKFNATFNSLYSRKYRD
ncbi:thyrotropin-releasing hormone receptor-like [Aplysia californica]|uniref:Thyrotropin-releasing hormone receptor-like n=1 Tax=Aplysia californica TaxID=6500 RepID=A0ABM0K5Q8_APLCA|nr:thyrotropin-releasing hormone receptor-like [Aplysia californica]